MHEQLGRAKEKIKRMWKLNCEQLMEHEALIEAEDDKTANLKARLTILEGRSSSPDTGHGRSTPLVGVYQLYQVACTEGKPHLWIVLLEKAWRYC